MKVKTITTPSDVIFFTNVEPLNFNVCTFRNIREVELSLFRKQIGFDLYESMLNSLADYSAVNAYAAGNSYQPSDVVAYEGYFYEALETTTANPKNRDAWKVAPRFEGDCAEAYDDFFCDYLGPYIAHQVLARRLPYIRNKILDKGVLEYQGGNFETTDGKQYDTLKSAVNRDASVIWENLVWYMSQEEQVEKKDTCFAGWLLFKDEKCERGDSKESKIKRAGLYDFG